MSRANYLLTEITLATDDRLDLERDTMKVALWFAGCLGVICYGQVWREWQRGDDDVIRTLILTTVMVATLLWLARRASARFDRRAGHVTLSDQWLWRVRASTLALDAIDRVEMRKGWMLDGRGLHLPFATGFPVLVLRDSTEIRLMGVDYGRPDETAALVATIRRWLAGEKMEDMA